MTSNSELFYQEFVAPLYEKYADDLNLFKINALDVRSHLHPEVTDPQQLSNDTLGVIQMCARNLRTRKKGQN